MSSARVDDCGRILIHFKMLVMMILFQLPLLLNRKNPFINIAGRNLDFWADWAWPHSPMFNRSSEYEIVRGQQFVADVLQGDR